MVQRRSGAALVAWAIALLLTTSSVAAAAATVADDAPKRALGAEKYALGLLNCTRTGGWVTRAGKCRARGTGRYSVRRAPLRRSKGISRKVAWPWGRSLTVAQSCGHVLPGEPELSLRLSLKGYDEASYGENVGCGWGGATPRQVVLSTHRLMQAEKSYGGGHWENMKERRFKSVGIGVATLNGRTTVVYDFYAKRAY